MQVRFVYGQVLDFLELPPNSIALDGAVQGPQLDPDTRRFSFDHHAGCVRMVTLATCQQVATALKLGLAVDEATVVLVNDLDADTVVAVWLLQHPERVDEPRVRELVEQVGLTDAHGPAYPPCAIHHEIQSPWGAKESPTPGMLERFLAKVTAYADGVYREQPTRPERLSRGYGWSPKTGWRPVETASGFGDLYNQGYLAGFLGNEMPDGTTVYTVAKRSDLVALSLGPSAVRFPPASPSDYRRDTILGQLALAELAVNRNQPHAVNWGGATSVGSSPRNPDGSGSRLTSEQVLGVCKMFAR